MTDADRIEITHRYEGECDSRYEDYVDLNFSEDPRREKQRGAFEGFPRSQRKTSEQPIEYASIRVRVSHGTLYKLRCPKGGEEGSLIQTLMILPLLSKVLLERPRKITKTGKVLLADVFHAALCEHAVWFFEG